MSKQNKYVNVNLNQDSDLILDAISEKISDRLFCRMEKHFVSKEQFFRYVIGVLVFLFLGYMSLTWENPKMIENIKKGEINPPVGTKSKL